MQKHRKKRVIKKRKNKISEDNRTQIQIVWESFLYAIRVVINSIS